MHETKKLCIYCNTESASVYSWTSEDTLTVCPNSPSHTVTLDSVYIAEESTDDIRYHEVLGTSTATGDVVSITHNGYAAVGYAYPSKYVFEDKSAASVACCKISDTQFVIAYTSTMSFPTTNNGFAVLCTRAGATLTYGTPVCFSGTSNTALTSISVTAISATDIVICYRAASTGGVVFGAASGTGAGGTLAFTSPGSFNTTAPGNQPGTIIVLRMSTTQIVVVYRDTGNSGRGTWIMATLAGTGVGITATWNTKAVFQTNTTGNNQYAMSADIIDATRFIVCYDNNTTALSAVIGTIAGTGAGATITAGITTATIDTNNTKSGRDCAIIVMDVTTALVFYRRTVDNITRGRCAKLTLSAGGVAAASQAATEGTSIYYTDAASIQSPAVIKTSATRAIISYISSNNGGAGELSIVDLAAGEPVSTLAGYVHASSVSFNCTAATSDGIIIFFRDVSYYNVGSGSVATFSGNTFDFNETVGRAHIGFSLHSAAAGDILKIYTGHRVDFLSGLTPGAVYYAHSNGTISTSNVTLNNADIPTYLGYATSQTQLSLSTR